MNKSKIKSLDFGEAVQTSRLARRLSRNDLAQLVDTDEKTIFRVEHGQMLLDFELAKKLVKTLELNENLLAVWSF